MERSIERRELIVTFLPGFFLKILKTEASEFLENHEVLFTQY